MVAPIALACRDRLVGHRSLAAGLCNLLVVGHGFAVDGLDLGCGRCFLPGILLAARFEAGCAIPGADGETLASVHLRFDGLQTEGSLPGTCHVGITLTAVPGRSIEVFV